MHPNILITHPQKISHVVEQIRNAFKGPMEIVDGKINGSPGDP